MLWGKKSQNPDVFWAMLALAFLKSRLRPTAVCRSGHNEKQCWFIVMDRKSRRKRHFSSAAFSCCHPHTPRRRVAPPLIDPGSSAEDGQLLTFSSLSYRRPRADSFFLFSPLSAATPTHHHGHSCLRLRVYVCCSTGETPAAAPPSFGTFLPSSVLSLKRAGRPQSGEKWESGV